MASVIKNSSTAADHPNAFDAKPENADVFEARPNDSAVFEARPGDTLCSASACQRPFLPYSRHDDDRNHSTTSGKGKRRKQNKRNKKKLLKLATIQWSGLRMIVESTFDQNYNWLSEMLEKWFLQHTDTSKKIIVQPAIDMLKFFVKYPLQIADIQRFLNLMDLTSRKWGQAILLLAIHEGNLEAVKRLLSEDQVDPNFVDNHGHSALLYSSCAKGGDILLELLQHESDIHFKDYRGRNAVWYAYKNDNYVAVEHLIHCGAILPDEVVDDDTNSDLIAYLAKDQDHSADNMELRKFLLPHRPLNKVKDSMTDESMLHNLSASDPDLSGQQIDNDTANIAFRGSETSAYSGNDFSSEVIYDGDDNDNSTECDDSSLGEVSNDFQTGNGSNSMISHTIELWKREIIGKFMAEVPGIIGYTGRVSSTANSTENNEVSSNNTMGSSSSSSSSSHPGKRVRTSNGSQRRLLGNGNDENEDDNEDEDYRGHRSNSEPESPYDRRGKQVRRFACPYHQKYPEIFDSGKRKCYKQSHGWPTIHRLK